MKWWPPGKAPLFVKGWPCKFDNVNTPIPITDQGFPACGLIQFAFLCQPFLSFGFHFWIPGLELIKRCYYLYYQSLDNYNNYITITITGVLPVLPLTGLLKMQISSKHLLKIISKKKSYSRLHQYNFFLLDIQWKRVRAGEHLNNNLFFFFCSQGGT